MTGTDHRAQFALRKRRQRVAATVFIAVLSVIAAGGGALHVPADYWMPALGAVGIVAVFFSLANWKCPACGASLSTRHPSRTCPDCDARLED